MIVFVSVARLRVGLGSADARPVDPVDESVRAEGRRRTLSSRAREL
jgi:hypothetical protein